MSESLHDYTGHLPVEVVRQPLTLALWVTDVPGEVGPEHGRPLGRLAIGVTLGGRDNPRLSADERAYILGVLRRAADFVAAGQANEPAGPGAWVGQPDVFADWPLTVFGEDTA